MIGDALRDPFLLASGDVGIEPACHALPKDRLEPRAGNEHVGALRVDVPELAVAQDEAVVGIEEKKALGQDLDRLLQTVMRLARASLRRCRLRLGAPQFLFGPPMGGKLRRHLAPRQAQVQFVDGDRRQFREALALFLGEAGARCRIDDAEGAHPMPILCDQRCPRIEADVRRAGDEGIVVKSGIERGIEHAEDLARENGVGAERVLARYFGDVQSEARLGPLPVLVGEGHQGNRRVQHPGGQTGDPVEGLFRPGVENLVPPQRQKTFSVVLGNRRRCHATAHGGPNVQPIGQVTRAGGHPNDRPERSK